MDWKYVENKNNNFPLYTSKNHHKIGCDTSTFFIIKIGYLWFGWLYKCLFAFFFPPSLGKVIVWTLCPHILKWDLKLESTIFFSFVSHINPNGMRQVANCYSYWNHGLSFCFSCSAFSIFSFLASLSCGGGSWWGESERDPWFSLTNNAYSQFATIIRTTYTILM